MELKRYCRLAVAITVTGLVCGPALPDEALSTICSVQRLSERPIQINSIARNRASGTIIASDPMDCRLFEYDLEGDLVHSSYRPRDPDACPVKIRAYRDGFVIQLGSQAFHRLDWSHISLGELSITNRPVRAIEGVTEQGPAYLMAVFDWIAMEEGILVFGDLLDRHERWISAFAYVPYNPDATAFQIEPVNISDPARNHYLINHNLMTSIGRTAYVLMMAERPFILKYDIGERRSVELTEFPEDIRRVPVLPNAARNEGVAQSTYHYKTVERETMPAALYSHDDSLFVLARINSGGMDGLPSWQLIEIDPDSGYDVWRTVLPSQAGDLVASAGETDWAFFEVGFVESIGSRYAPFRLVGDMIVIASEHLENSYGIGEIPRTSCAK